MLLRLAVLGTLGYVGYRYLQQQQPAGDQDSSPRQLALAGGPLSDQASIQSDPDVPPAFNAGTQDHAPSQT
jgi:hypothetical protein